MGPDPTAALLRGWAVGWDYFSPSLLNDHQSLEAHLEKPFRDLGALLPEGCPIPRLSASSAPCLPLKGVWGPVPAGPTSGDLQRVPEPYTLILHWSPPPPRFRGVTHPLLLSCSADAGQTAEQARGPASQWGGRLGRGPGAGTGCQGAAPASPAAPGAVAPTRAHARTFPRAA